MYFVFDLEYEVIRIQILIYSLHILKAFQEHEINSQGISNTIYEGKIIQKMFEIQLHYNLKISLQNKILIP